MKLIYNEVEYGLKSNSDFKSIHKYIGGMIRKK